MASSGTSSWVDAWLDACTNPKTYRGLLNYLNDQDKPQATNQDIREALASQSVDPDKPIVLPPDFK